MMTCVEQDGTDSRAEQAEGEGLPIGRYSQMGGRKGFLLLVGAAAVAAGVVLGRAGILLDCLLVFSVCLTAAVLVVTFSAGSVQEIQGFPLLVVLATAVRITTCLAIGKAVLTEGVGGKVVEMLTVVFIRDNLVFATLIFLAAGAAVSVVIFKSLSSIRRTEAGFTVSGGLEGHKSFFSAMKGAAGFMIFAAVVEVIVIVSTMGGGLSVRLWGGYGMSAWNCVALAVGAGILTQLLALGCAFGSRYLVFITYKSAQLESEANELMVQLEPAVKVVSNEVICSRVESSAAMVEEAALEADEVAAEDVEWYEGGEEVEEYRGGTGFRPWNSGEVRNKRNSEEIAERILSGGKESSRLILLVAEERRELGVTAPVNIAMRLAQKGKKCLLVDLDRERDAISRVFDTAIVEASGTESGAVKTCIGNLWVWRCDCQKVAEKQLRRIPANSEDNYDHVILYAPNRRCWAEIEGFHGSAMKVMLFGSGDGSNAMAALREKMVMGGSTIFEPEFATIA